ncbi:MAG: HpcH/HpaI aldolase/citrate lyase family protein [Rubrivivax sp.]
MSVFRSFLFAPGNHARRVEKCLTLGADAVILDLEDAVAIAEKPATRAVVVQALQRPRRGLGYVRVNALSTEWSHGDFQAVVAPGVDGIVLPKVERASDVLTAEWLLRSLEHDRGLPVGGIDLMPIVETGLGFTHLREILRAGTRVRRVAFGAGDFTLDIALQWSAGEGELLPYRSAFVVESRAAGLEPPVDTVWIRLQDAPGFAASVRQARDLGFQGKMCIHPDQVPVVNDFFRPGEAELEHARRVIEAFAEAERQGLAAIQVEGRFIDYPIVYLAQRLLARAEAIERAEAAGRAALAGHAG